MTVTAQKRRKLIPVERDVISTAGYHVDVETMGALAVGRMVIETRFRSRKPPNAQVAMDADTARLGRCVVETLCR